MTTQTRLTKRELQNMANQMSAWASILAMAAENNDTEAVKRISKRIRAEAVSLTHRLIGV